ncbi:MAG: hypothetical protein K6E18_09370 [Lachnospiraceae bacterium]|nr:hypothetical protein [Lachnospiraceae bacterium]
MGNVITAAVIAILFVLAGCFVYKEKKKGKKCADCPMADHCERSSFKSIRKS